MYSKDLTKVAIGLSAFGYGNGLGDLESQVEKSLFGGARGELGEYLRKNKRTLNEEYELIQQKKSLLSRRMREYVEYLHSKAQDDKEEGEGEV